MPERSEGFYERMRVEKEGTSSPRKGASMLSMAIILAFMSVALEMFLVTQFEFMRKFLIRFEKIGLIFSFAVSFFMGEAFGAHGVIALFAGIMSTVITVVIYKLHLLHLVDEYKLHQEQIQAKAKEVWTVTVRTMVFWWKVVTAPVRFGMMVKRKFRNTKIHVQHAHSKIKGIHFPSFRRVDA